MNAELPLEVVSHKRLGLVGEDVILVYIKPKRPIPAELPSAPAIHAP